MSQDSPFYTDGAQYWEKIEPTVDGMLGGYAQISDIDLQGSQRFLNSLYQVLIEKPKKNRAIDCGAGIGRITQGFLMKNFPIVDLVEQDGKFLQTAQNTLATTRHQGQFFHSGLQNFNPENGAYDVIWIQWVLGHLTDEDLVAFLKRCQSGLQPNGLVVIKENVTSSGEVEMDSTDSSVTRPYVLLCDVIKRSGLRIVKDQIQQRFPKDLYEVRMLAMRPDKTVASQ
nr:EOG090X0EJQ [Sida crystallina]